MDGLPAGRLDQRVEVQSVTLVRQPDGTSAKTWATYATVWAEIEYTPSTEAAGSGAVGAVRQYRVRIRYLADLRHTDRLVLGSRVLNILSISLPGNKRLVWELVCAEEVT